MSSSAIIQDSRYFVLIVLAATLYFSVSVSVSSAFAQSQEMFINPPDELVEKLTVLARPHISKAKLPDGSFVPPETEEELASSIIPSDDAKFIIDSGMVSGLALWCSLNWDDRNFKPLMAWQRSRDVWTGKQIAFIGLLHGVAMGLTERGHGGGNCPEKYKDRLDNYLKHQW